MIEQCEACGWLIDFGACGCPGGRPRGPFTPMQKVGGEWVPADAALQASPLTAELGPREEN